MQPSTHSQMFFDDDLPVWGFVGKVERPRPKGLKDGLTGGPPRTFLFTHFHFDVAYNGDQVGCMFVAGVVGGVLWVPLCHGCVAAAVVVVVVVSCFC